MYDPVIFDLDGTLLDTLGDLAAAGNYALRTLGFPEHDADEYKYFVGNGIPTLIERILPEKHSKDDSGRAYVLFGDFYSLHCADMTRPYAGISELLEKLKGRGITALCNSNKDHDFSAGLLRKFFGENIVEAVGAGVNFPTKPAPDAARYLAAKYHKEGAKPLYVGDSGVDMQTALNAKIDGCGVLWGFRKREELEKFGPKFLAQNVDELFEFIVNN